MKKKTIAIIFGGCSSEYSVSLQSAYSVIINMDQEKYELLLLGITKTGEWILYGGEVDKIRADTWQSDKTCKKAMITPDRKLHGILFFDENYKCNSIRIDAAFPVLHGKNGEDGSVQGLLSLAGIPVVGCQMLPSALCMDKARAHILAKNAGVEVPSGIVVRRGERPERMQEELIGLKYPLFVKPVRGGSSIGMTKIKSEGELISALTIAFQHDDEVLVEEHVEGFEVGCAVIGNHQLLISSVDEIELLTDVFDYHEKYTQEYSKIHLPARITESVARRVQDAVETIYKALGCNGFARVDLFLTPEGRIVFNEVNTIPGLTEHSRYPNMVKGMGISYPELLNQLIALAF